MSTQIIAALAAVGLVGAGVAGTAETRSFDAIPGAIALMGDGVGGATGDKCRVDVIRSGTPGSADIARQVLNNGQCVCVVTTGQVKANGSAEDIVKALLRDRTCDGAPLADAAGTPVGHAVAGASAGGGTGALLPVLIGGVGAAGLAVALGKSSKG
ncbi:MAG: hypothetical protein JSR28_01155 [Proteobacteria bacterium]|nr:hypothetical protein [Pseudomonadota bacterium]